MDYIIDVEQLPVPVIYKGGYMYSYPSVGILNGAPLPVSERWASQPWSETCKRAECLQLLEAAPVGSIYTYTEYGQEAEAEYCREYHKLESGQWIDLPGIPD